MKFQYGQMIQTHPITFPGRFLRWAPWVTPGLACLGYFSGVLTTQSLSLLSLLLLTGIYGAWLVLYRIGVRQFVGRPHPWWLLALFCLACASQFIPLPGTNVYWLPLLPVLTTSLMTAIKPRFLSLLASGVLCLSAYLATRRVIPDWEISGQVLLLISFLSTYEYMAIIRALAGAHTALEASNAKLTVAHAQLQEYSAQVEELSVVRERNRIAREIHDTLGHALTLLSVRLETATQLDARGDPRLHEELLQARQVARGCLTDVRHSVEALRPDEASHSSLQEQLQRLVVTSETTCPETRITLDLEDVIPPLDPEVRLTLYRCAQEALTNIRKHAHATKVLLRLSSSDEETGQVELTVLDNGEGGKSIPEQRVSGFGLRGMRERVVLLDGRLWARAWLARRGDAPAHITGANRGQRTVSTQNERDGLALTGRMRMWLHPGVREEKRVAFEKELLSVSLIASPRLAGLQTLCCQCAKETSYRQHMQITN